MHVTWNSYNFRSILHPISRQEFDGALGHKVERTEKDILMAKVVH